MTDPKPIELASSNSYVLREVTCSSGRIRSLLVCPRQDHLYSTIEVAHWCSTQCYLFLHLFHTFWAAVVFYSPDKSFFILLCSRVPGTIFPVSIVLSYSGE